MKRILFIALAALSVACTKTEYKYEYAYKEPELGSLSVSSVTAQSVLLEGSVSRDGGQTVSERGFYLSTSSFKNEPPSSARKIVAQDPSGEGKFSMEITGLMQGTTYYVCSYAINSIGKTFSATKTFSTKRTAKVILGDVEVETLSILKTENSSDHDYDYDLDLKLSVSFEDVGSFVSAGVCVDGYEYTYGETLPSTDATSIIVKSTTPYYNTGEIKINAFAFANDRNGNRVVSESRDISFSAMGVSLRPEAHVSETDWYSEPDKNYYIHYFDIGVRVITGGANISELGVFPTSTYKTVSFTPGSFQDYTYYSTIETIKSDNKEETLSAYGKGRLKNGMDFYAWDFKTGANTATSSFGTGTSYEVFFSEDFTDGLGKFTATADTLGSYVWEWDSANKALKANAYSGGANRAAKTSCISNTIDLRNRKMAYFLFSASSKYFTTLNEDVSLSIYSSNDDKWYTVSLGLTNDKGWESKIINLSEFIGDEIKIAFRYKSSEASCGSILIDNIELFSLENGASNTSSAAARLARINAASTRVNEKEQATINKTQYENIRRKSLR